MGGRQKPTPLWPIDELEALRVVTQVVTTVTTSLVHPDSATIGEREGGISFLQDSGLPRYDVVSKGGISFRQLRSAQTASRRPHGGPVRLRSRRPLALYLALGMAFFLCVRFLVPLVGSFPSRRPASYHADDLYMDLPRRLHMGMAARTAFREQAAERIPMLVPRVIHQIVSSRRLLEVGLWCLFWQPAIAANQRLTNVSAVSDQYPTRSAPS